MDIQDQLTQMREILYRPASAATWHDLLVLFECWPHQDGFQVALDYANTHLESWPARLRLAPRRWVELLLEKKRPHPAWPLVRSVALPNQGLGPEDAYSLARNRSMSRVERLLLANNHLGEEGVGYLAQSKHLSHLHTLDLSRNGLRGRLESMTAPDALPALHTLVLEGNNLGDSSLEALLEAPYWTQLARLELEGLSLSRHGITGQSVAQMVKRGAPALQHLSLYGQRLDTSAAQCLGQAFGAFPCLEVLNLSYNRFREEGAYALLGAKPMPKLKHLILRGCYVSEVDQQALRTLFAQQYPGARLEIP